MNQLRVKELIKVKKIFKVIFAKNHVYVFPIECSFLVHIETLHRPFTLLPVHLVHLRTIGPSDFVVLGTAGLWTIGGPLD